ncbi:sulfotransferase 1C4-like [Amyelois transitella]|uniref:sulfotransferase 1C4-like n=1 Tax=Amyelois transitella TaxID=680683 RepID=UPI00298F4C1D|nr:sulfotransferase 1C4-like [Amyelois transitella]
MGTKGEESFPLEIRRLNEKEQAEVSKDIEGGFMKHCFRVGPQGYFFSDPFEPLIPQIYNLELRADDVFIATFPKAGTTWTQELVWLVANELDYDTAKRVPLTVRCPFLEFSVFSHNDVGQALIKQACEVDKTKYEIAKNLKKNGIEVANELPSPRFIKTHQPFSLLPPDLLEKTKVVYTARDPRDVVVSYYHHQKFMPIYGYKGEFKDFWKLFKKDMLDWTPFFSHFREAWELRNHPNLLFLFYEELSKDMPGVIRRVAKFLGKTVTEEQISGLCEHLKFENFRKNKSVNYEVLGELGFIKKGEHFVRKGKTGGWREYFDEEMTKEAEEWMEEGLKGIDFKFKF